jgi:hypothetical protein
MLHYEGHEEHEKNQCCRQKPESEDNLFVPFVRSFENSE